MQRDRPLAQQSRFCHGRTRITKPCPKGEGFFLAVVSRPGKRNSFSASSASLRLTLFRYFLCIAAIAALLSCSSHAERSFKREVSRLTAYMSKHPHLLTSRKILKDGKETHVYYVLKVERFQANDSVERTFLSDVPYGGSITILCSVADNSGRGDVASDTIDFAKSLGAEGTKDKGFSTTDLALRNGDFSPSPETLAVYLKYLYEKDRWSYKGLSLGGAPELLLVDLQQLPQNKPFRQAIGMEG